MARSLDNLPSLVLEGVCDYLETYPSSLVAFACASKTCYHSTTFLLFKTIKLSTPSGLSDDVHRCHNMLQRTVCFGRVRRLIIDGPPPPELGQEPVGLYQGVFPWLRPEDRGYSEHFLDFAPQTQTYVFRADKKPATAAYETNDIWKPLASLIKQLPSLTDLIYRCPSQFPPCLLEALHEQRPQCRLHIDTLKLRSLNAPLTDPYEIKLATSPCLYSIKLECDNQSGFLSGDVQNFNYEAVQSLVAGLAPNLRHLHISHGHLSARPLYEPCRPWQGFTPNNYTQRALPSSGSLRSLQIRVHNTLVDSQLIETWKIQTDFSTLRVLNFDSCIAQDMIECLAANSTFPSLRELVLPLASKAISYPQPSDFYDNADRFLCSLPALSSLKLSGELYRLSMSAIIENHGSALRQLRLTPLMGDKRLLPEDIAHIGVHCPLLEELSLTLCRSKADATEVATYRALGSIKRLQNLSLRLDASNFAILGDAAYAEFNVRHPNVVVPEAPSDPSFDDFDQQFFTKKGRVGTSYWRDPRIGHIRDAFINSAVDEALVRAIFGSISSGKAAGSLPLEKLKISVAGGSSFGEKGSAIGIGIVVVELSCSWTCERSPRDDCRHDLLITELPGLYDDRIRDRGRTEQVARLSPNVEQVFRRIWPATKKTGGDWREDWRSLPLGMALGEWLPTNYDATPLIQSETETENRSWPRFQILRY